MATKANQQMSEILHFVQEKIQKMQDELSLAKDKLDELLPKFNQTAFKSDLYYNQKKKRLMRILNQDVLRGIKQGRGFIKKRFGTAIEELEDLIHNKYKDSE